MTSQLRYYVYLIRTLEGTEYRPGAFKQRQCT